MLISISDLIKKTLEIYTKHFFLILKYLLLALVPSILGTSASVYIMRWMSETGSYDALIMYLGIPLVLVVFIILIICSLWFNFALIKAIHQLYCGDATKTIKETLLDTKHIIVKGLKTSIMSGLYSGWPMIITVIAVILRLHYADYLPPALALISNIILPFLGLYAILHLTYFVIRLAFSMFISVLENANWKTSLDQSQSMVKNRWSAIAGRVVVPVFVIYIVLMLVDITLATVGSLTGDIGNYVMTVIDMFVNYLAVPISLIVGVILYEEVKKTPIITPPTV